MQEVGTDRESQKQRRTEGEWDGKSSYVNIYKVHILNSSGFYLSFLQLDV